MLEAVEGTLELVGVAVLIIALLGHIQRHIAPVEVRLLVVR